MRHDLANIVIERWRLAITGADDQLVARAGKALEYAGLDIDDVLRVRLVGNQRDELRAAQCQGPCLRVRLVAVLVDDFQDLVAGFTLDQAGPVDDSRDCFLRDIGQPRDVRDRQFFAV